MSGRLGNYWELVKAAEQARIAITKAQQKQIADLYQEIADDLNHRLQRYDSKSLTYRWVKDYAKNLQKDSKRLYTTIKSGVADSLLQSAKAPVKAEQAFYSGLASGLSKHASDALSKHFSDVFSRVPQSAADELMSGGIYKDFSGLSDRIWNYRKKYNRDIQTVIVKGIQAQKSAFDLAKDLEMYVDPKAAKPWNWNIVYPGVNQVVDYNAQRLARTAVTHAYQLSFQRATKDNPFVESYKWHSSHGSRMCELCAQRDGRIYRKDALPFDHPNGMCTVTAVIPKSYDEIGKELGDWAAGKSDSPALDKWLLKSDDGNDTISINKQQPLKIDLQLFAHIPEEKFTKYALDPKRQPDKARAFKESLGYSMNNYQDLIDNIYQHIDESKFVEKGDEGYGMKYEYIMRLHGVNGKEANVLTAWIKDSDDVRLTSAYVTKRKVLK